jgi:hypothetical protein
MSRQVTRDIKVSFIEEFRWIDNIKIDLLERIECCGLDWSGSG